MDARLLTTWVVSLTTDTSGPPRCEMMGVDVVRAFLSWWSTSGRWARMVASWGSIARTQLCSHFSFAVCEEERVRAIHILTYKTSAAAGSGFFFGLVFWLVVSLALYSKTSMGPREWALSTKSRIDHRRSRTPFETRQEHRYVSPFAPFSRHNQPLRLFSCSLEPSARR